MNFNAYEIVAVGIRGIDFHNMRKSFEDIEDKLYSINEFVLVRKGRQD